MSRGDHTRPQDCHWRNLIAFHQSEAYLAKFKKLKLSAKVKPLEKIKKNRYGIITSY